MLDLNDYLDPVSIEKPDFEHLAGNAGFPHNVSINTESTPINAGSIGKYKVALLGVPDGRNSFTSGSSAGPDAIRSQLYRIAKVPGKTRIADLGNMKPGAAFADTLAGLTDLLGALLDENVFPVILGGSSALVTAADRALSSRDKKYTLLAVDPRIDYSNESDIPHSFSYLNGIVNNSRSSFSQYVNIGYQTYLNDQQVLNRFDRRHSILVRIGDVRQAIHLTEPLFRDSDVAVFDISAVRQSDAPGTAIPSPNGFYGEEICLLARYAGISDNLKIFGLFELNPGLDVRSQTSGLAAQIIWFFLEGFSQKQYETPVLSSSNAGRFIKYHVRITGLDDDVIFVRSSLTERWWMELTDDAGTSIYIACSHDDYLQANRNEVPDRWVRAARRIKS